MQRSSAYIQSGSGVFAVQEMAYAREVLGFDGVSCSTNSDGDLAELTFSRPFWFIYGLLLTR